MLFKSTLLIGISSLLLFACQQDNPAPASQPASTEIEAHFYGEFNTTAVELTSNVSGYDVHYSNIDTILAPPYFSETAYFSLLDSPQSATSVQIGYGSLYWNASSPTDPGPSLSEFDIYFQSNLPMVFSNAADEGFEFIYTDANGREWKSDEESTMPMSVQVTGRVQESTATGDFAKYTFTFDCWVYSLNPDSLALNPSVNHLDSIHVENAQYKSKFKR